MLVALAENSPYSELSLALRRLWWKRMLEWLTEVGNISVERVNLDLETLYYQYVVGRGNLTLGTALIQTRYYLALQQWDAS